MGEDDHYLSTNLPTPKNINTLRKNDKHIYIATYNTRTLRTNESLTELIIALANLNWTIIGMSEVRRQGECIEDHGNFIFYYKGTTPGQYGVGFLIDKKLHNNIDEFIGISERIAILNIRLPPKNAMWSIIQIYSPTEQSSNTEIDTFYSTLTKAIKDHTYSNLIIMGDFNARTGHRREGEETILGPYCFGKRTRNGDKLIQLAHENHLKILNSVYKNRENNRWTWISPNSEYKNEIDYILTNRDNCFQDCKVVKNFNFNSNHRMVRTKMKINEPRITRPFKAKPNTILSTNITLTKESLQEFMENTIDLNVKDKYNKMQGLLSTKKTIRSKEGIRIKWISEETETLLKARAELIKIVNKTKSIRSNITEISKQIKLNLRKDRQKQRLETLDKCIRKTGGIKKAIKQLLEKRDWIPKMKNTNQQLETKRANISAIATNFFRDLYSSENKNVIPTDLSRVETVPEIMRSEVEWAIQSQKKDKTPGADGISNELLICNKDLVIPALTYMFNEVLRNEVIPDQWMTSTIILLHKKGDKDNIGNYRPISLMSNVYKVFAKVILNRISKTLDDNQPIEQAGFRRGYSTLDHIFVVKQLFEKSNEYKETFYCCFIDYSKAFDSLHHESIWQALKNQGVCIKYIRILKMVYQNSTAKIKLEEEGDEIKIERGVRQGDPISPKLFTAVLEEVFRHLNWEKYGIKINGENLTHLRFADDIIIFSPSIDNLQIMLKELDSESQKVGLAMNLGKTKVMTNSNRKPPIYINNKLIEYVNEYIYLGQIISPIDLTTKEIERRIGNAWKRYWSLKEIMKNPEMNMTIKRKLYNTCILPVLTYGCQSWALTKTQMRKLETCQNAMERSMLGKKKSERIRTTTIKKLTRLKDVAVTVKKLKWKWTGHILRGINKWSKTIINWYPKYKTRKRGRPFKRWTDELKAMAGSLWSRLAGDRMVWRQLGEAFANRQTDTEF